METDVSDSAPLPWDRSELLQCIQDEWSALERAIGSLSDAQLTLPGPDGWSVQDHLAHLAAWERFMRLHHLQGLPPHEVLGVDQATFGRGDEDELNAILFDRNRGGSLSDTLAELHRTHEAVLGDLENMPLADLMQQHYADDPEARPLLCFIIYNTYEHYAEHRKTIEQLAGHASAA